MKKLTIILLFAGITISSAAMSAQDIPVRRVILSTSGLANFELRASVKGDTALEFPVRLEQVDDILKSLVVFDGGGTIGSVTLPGKQPLMQSFKDLPFTRAQLDSPMLLLNAYQGAMVTIKEAGTSTTGKILYVQPETLSMKDGVTMVRHRANLMTDAGIKQVVLEDAQSVYFEDQGVRNEITRALEDIRENAASEKRVLTVNLSGKGNREVALSYVVDAPLWKTAYRMVLPETAKGSGLLQGWAVVENMTANDWQDIDLTLVSGNPVTYRQALYESYYVDRPEVPVQVFGRVMPRVDNGELGSASDLEERLPSPSFLSRAKSIPAAPDNLDAMMMTNEVAVGQNNYPVVSAAMVAPAQNVAESSDAATQVLFRFPGSLSLKSGQSMMLPFVSRNIQMERVFLYQPETNASHPLAAVEISNDGETSLPSGILTLYEENSLLKGTGFVGDAQFPMLGQGEKRIVSYALDSKTDVLKDEKSISTNNRIAVSSGVIRTEVVNRIETSYTIRAPAKEDRVVIIEHLKTSGYKLVSPDPASVEVTGTHYRIRTPVKAGEVEVVTVALERTAWQSYDIANLSADQMLAYSHSDGKLDDATRKAFEALAGVRQEISAIEGRIEESKRQKQVIFEDQRRVRENLKSLDSKSDVQQKYLEKLSSQEDSIAAIDKRLEELSKKRMDLQSKLSLMIKDIKF